MTSKGSRPEDASELRRQAEKTIREKAGRMPENQEALSPEETRQTLHELQVHQIELEMQNEELRRAQTELDASRARYFDLYDLAPVGYFSLSEHGLILEANLTAASLLGVARSALAKQPLPRFIVPEDEAIYYRYHKQVFAAGAPQVCELRMLRADAAPFWAQLEATAVQDGESGEPVCRVVVSDITERKQAEQAVRQSHDELQAIYDGAIDGLLVADAETKRFVRTNPTMCRMLGYSEEELLSMSVMEIHPPTAVRTILEQFKAMMEDRLTAAQGCPLLRKDGTEIYADIGCKFVVFNGRPCAIEFFHDVTEQKRAEGLVRAANTLLSLLPEKSSRKDYLDAVVELLRSWTGCRCAGIRGVDEQGRIPYEAYAGFSQEFWSQENELILHRDQCACTRIILGQLLPQDAPAMTPGGSFVCRRLSEFAKRLSKEDASQFRGICIQSGFESLALIPLRHQGQVLGLIHLADETPDMIPPKTAELLESLAPLVGAAIHRLNLEEALQKRERELRQAKAAAEAANEAKGRFLANISHELRTPMNAILGMVDLALPKQADSTAKDFLQTARESADLLLTLLNDLLDSAKIEAGKLELELAPFSLRRVLNQTSQVLAVRASEKGISFSCHSDIPCEVPDALVGDQVRLRQVLLNLAGNAIKFTERGEVTVSVRISADPGTSQRSAGEETVMLEFAVRDTGIGIPPSDVEHIFHPFAQADTSTTRRFGGTGLGLTICSSLVRLMGGRIWVESEVGKGSTFYFTVRLPLAKELPPEPETPDVLTAAPTTLRILLVEDNPANQKIAAYILQERGHTVAIAGDGRQGLNMAQQNYYNVILMDVQMPGMDGLEATKAIRAGEDSQRRVPIIAMTAHAMPSDRERCLAAGMDDYLSKPIDGHEMIALVERLAAGATPPAPTPAQAEPASAPAANVFDPELALKRCYNSQKMVGEMMASFFNEANSLLPQLRAALQEGDLQEVGRLGHRLKGTFVYLGAEPAREAALRVERFMLHAGQQPEAEEAVRVFERECEVLRAVLAEYQATASPTRGGP